VHDEIILEVPEWVAREVAVILKKTMIGLGKLISVKFRLKWGFRLRTIGQMKQE
jgi:DNA polymerase I-like protein with 3'-5' exonuclease and polymerase domains